MGRVRRHRHAIGLALTASLALAACTDNLAARVRANDTDSVLETDPIEPVSFDALYVVNGESATISVINAETDTLASTITLRGAAYPRHIALSPDRSLLGIAVPGYDMSMGEFGHEHHSSRPGHVLLLDAVTGSLKAAKRTDAANNNVAFSADGTSVWTSQATSPGSTLVLDAADLETRDAIPVGTAPAKTVISSDGSVAYVPNSGSANVSVIDVATRTVRATVRVGAGPIGVQPGTDGHVYVVNEPDQSLSVIDRASLTVVRTLDVGDTPGNVTTAEDGKLWVTLPKKGAVEVRDPNGAVLTTIPTAAGANSVVFSPDGMRAYVSNELADSVSVIDRATLRVRATVSVGGKPNGMAYRAKP